MNLPSIVTTGAGSGALASVASKALPTVFSIGAKATSMLGWGVLASEAVELIVDLVVKYFKKNGINLNQKEVKEFIDTNGEEFVYAHILLNFELSASLTFNVFNEDFSSLVGDLNEDGQIDVLDLILNDIQRLPADNDLFTQRIEEAFKQKNIKSYMKTILLSKAGTPQFNSILEDLYRNWVYFCYDKNIWRAFPKTYQTRIQAIQYLIQEIYEIAITDPKIADYVHSLSEYSFPSIQEEVLDELEINDGDRYENIVGDPRFSLESSNNARSFR